MLPELGQTPRLMQRAGSLLVLGLLVLGPLLLAPLPAEAGGTVQQDRFYSGAVGMERTLSVYLPEGYRGGEQRYPVLFVLHGLEGDHSDFFTHAGLARTLDRLIGSGAVRPTIVIAPDGGDGYWTNHVPIEGRPGPRWADYVALDLVDRVDRTWRTVPSREARALAGLSMGGYGALSIALRHPDRFAAAVSLSGALFQEPPTHRRIYLEAWGSPPDRAWFERSSPLHLVRSLPVGTRFPRIWLSCGDDDALGFLAHTLAVHDALEERKLDHELRVLDGGHSWELWRSQSEDWLRFIEGSWAWQP